MAKRGEPVAPPARKDGWKLRHTSGSPDGWKELCNQAPGPAREAFDRLEQHPLVQSKDQYQLKADLATKVVGGKTLPHWQYKPTGSGRIWYAVDADAKVVHLTNVTVGHPKETE